MDLRQLWTEIINMLFFPVLHGCIVLTALGVFGEKKGNIYINECPGLAKDRVGECFMVKSQTRECAFTLFP